MQQRQRSASSFWSRLLMEIQFLVETCLVVIMHRAGLAWTALLWRILVAV